MTGKLLKEEELEEIWTFVNTSARDVRTAALIRTSGQLLVHISALTEKLRESEAGAAALREALDKFGHTPSCQDDADVGISECCGAGIASCETTAGLDLLERLRKAEAELTQAIEDRSNAVEIAHTEQGNTIRAERERDASILYEVSAEARVKELERALRDAIDCAGSLNIKLAISDSKLRVAEKRSEAAMPDPVRAALVKCAWGVERSIEVLHQHDTSHPDCGVSHPVTIDNLREVLRAARDAGVGA